MPELTNLFPSQLVKTLLGELMLDAMPISDLQSKSLAEQRG
jgi:hypothetical protein